MTRRQIRKASGLSLAAVAARAGKSIPTARVYELNDSAVTTQTKAAFDPVYDRLEVDLLAQLLKSRPKPARVLPLTKKGAR